MTKNTFGSRVKDSRVAISVTQTELSRLVGVSRQQIANYEKNTSKPKEIAMNKLAASLGVGASWLNTGIGEKFEGKPFQAGDAISYIHKRIPLISWDELCLLPDRLCDTKPLDWFFPPNEVDKLAFGLTVKGNAMEPVFCEGSIIVIDPSIEYQSGDYVVVHFSEINDFTFSKIIYETGNIFLQPINSGFPMHNVHEKDINVLGVVTTVMQKVISR